LGVDCRQQFGEAETDPAIAVFRSVIEEHLQPAKVVFRWGQDPWRIDLRLR
jgi:hypothetical protein